MRQTTIKESSKKRLIDYQNIQLPHLLDKIVVVMLIRYVMVPDNFFNCLDTLNIEDDIFKSYLLDIVKCNEEFRKVSTNSTEWITGCSLALMSVLEGPNPTEKKIDYISKKNEVIKVMMLFITKFSVIRVKFMKMK